ncbi:MAG TPA: hemerythrin domain-containing protein [Polyangiaceae bacterium]|nr:hemerythrin domain-containing protein [Polyangiaceae bacterium]
MSTEIKAHSTSSGAVVGPEADAFGLGALFNTLMEEHGYVTRLIALAIAAETPEASENMYPALRSSLLSHEQTEAAVLYSTLRQYSSAAQLVDAHARDAEELETVIHTLDSLRATSSEWRAQLESLSALIREHVRKEEDEFFPFARATLGEVASHDLRADYLRTKQGVANTVEADFAALSRVDS